MDLIGSSKNIANTLTSDYGKNIDEYNAMTYDQEPVNVKMKLMLTRKLFQIIPE